MRQQVIYNEKVAHLGSSSNILFRTLIGTTLSPTFFRVPLFHPPLPGHAHGKTNPYYLLPRHVIFSHKRERIIILSPNCIVATVSSLSLSPSASA